MGAVRRPGRIPNLLAALPKGAEVLILARKQGFWRETGESWVLSRREATWFE